MTSRTRSCTPESALAAFNFYDQATTLPKQGLHLYNMGNAIIEWTGFDASIITVCRDWKAVVERYLLHKWQQRTDKFDVQKRQINRANISDRSNPFALFRLFNAALERQLDDTILKPIRARFQGTLSIDKYNVRHHEICLAEATQNLWMVLQQQNTKLPQLQSYLSIKVEFSNPSSAHLFKNVNKLKMFDMELTVLPDELFSLSELTYLDLSENELSDLPEEITQLQKLTYLNISGKSHS